MRGGVVFDFYIIPLIPIIALNVAMVLETIVRFVCRAVRFERLTPVLILLVLVALVSYDFQQSLSPKDIYTLRPTVVQVEALDWIHANVSPREVIVINSTLYTDLHEPQGVGVGNGAIYPYAHEYQSVATDPTVYDTLLQSNWDRIDYLVVNAEMLNIIRTSGGGMDLINTALKHSILREHFQTDGEFVDIYQVIHKYPQPNI